MRPKILVETFSYNKITYKNHTIVLRGIYSNPHNDDMKSKIQIQVMKFDDIDTTDDEGEGIIILSVDDDFKNRSDYNIFFNRIDGNIIPLDNVGDLSELKLEEDSNIFRITSETNEISFCRNKDSMLIILKENKYREVIYDKTISI